jgi:aminobenzoyl-glutamate transport protein
MRGIVPAMANPTTTAKSGTLTRFLDFIERIGNKLPEPSILFAIMAAMVIVLSAVGAAANWEVQPVRVVPMMTPAVDAAGNAILNADGTPEMVVKLDDRGRPERTTQDIGAALTPRSLLTTEGVYWMLSSMVRNFTGLPALGLVFVAMLGIGLAEKFGLFSALMRCLALATPKAILTPMVVFVGANSSVASDAGYIILPPLAAALYHAVGRSPIAGLAAAFAGVAGGFGGGLFPTAADTFLAGVATQAAHIIDTSYPDVSTLHNFYFKAGSSVIVMIAGWLVTDLIIEPRLRKQKAKSEPEANDAAVIADLSLTRSEKRGLAVAGVVAAAVLGVFAWLILVPGNPLHGSGVPVLANGHIPATQAITIVPRDDAASVARDRVIFDFKNEETVKNEDGTTSTVVIDPGFVVAAPDGTKPAMTERPGSRWTQVIVPMILLVFLLPGMAYGFVTGALRTQSHFIEAIYHGVRTIVPVLTIAFFLGQFVNYFQYTGLDRMLAFAGGKLLIHADLPPALLVVLFIMLVVAGDFVMSGMLSKFGVMAPIFIPMFMMVGISPELTTAAYRIGDSVVNIITPLNSYLLIILVVLQKYKKNAGLGSLISLMLPYSLVFGVMWAGLLLFWMATGMPLGPGSGLWTE